jgi:hypothetical protein
MGVSYVWSALGLLSIFAVILGWYRAWVNGSFLHFILTFLIPYYGLFYFFLAKKKNVKKTQIPDNLKDDV